MLITQLIDPLFLMDTQKVFLAIAFQYKFQKHKAMLKDSHILINQLIELIEL